MTDHLSQRMAPLPAIVLVGVFTFIACDQGASTPDSAVDAGPADATWDGTSCPSGPERNGPYTRVTVVGETSALGIIDPSVEYAAGAGAGLMTYTAVPDFAHVHIAIAESADNGADLNDLILPRDAKLSARFDSGLLGGVTVVSARARRVDRRAWKDTLYRPVGTPTRPAALKAVPYCIWDNRRPGEMLVWIREA